MPAARVVAVAPGSPAAAAGVAPGDEILTVNGGAVRDVIEYHLQADEPVVELDVRSGGLERTVTVEKALGEPLGLELATPVFDRIRTCDNHCPFCFIHQLPAGMRKSLYLRDDDYRLSFLYGNFTTLTRFTEADLERVVDERLSPLYVSIHATDPDIRARLLRNRRGATSLRWLELLLDAGIEVHGQVVVCPGINDGAVLDDTLRGILERFPSLRSVGVVPLGVSDHQREPEMRHHTRREAAAVVECVEEWQGTFLQLLGRRLAHAADEYYLLAGRPFPEPERYEGFPQHENGIGMATTFVADVRAALDGTSGADVPADRGGFFAWVEGADQQPSSGRWSAVAGAPADGYRAPRRGAITGAGERVAGSPRAGRAPVAILTGSLGAAVLAPLIGAMGERAGVPIELVPVVNRFFGGNIGVTGLLTGADVRSALAGVPERHRVLLPDVVLSRGRFLDGLTVDELGRPVEVVATDGRALVAALGP
jgi:putative radical SAM enzyme (TIGR03279 family)